MNDELGDSAAGFGTHHLGRTRSGRGVGELATKAAILMPDALCFDVHDNLYVGKKYCFRLLGVNPGGSSSYGLDFAKMVLGDWGGEDYLP